MASVSPRDITFGCPKCGCKLTAQAGSGPLEGPCPKCGEHIRTAIPQDAGLASHAPAEMSGIPAAPAPLIAPAEVRPASAPPPQQQQQRALFCACLTCGHHQGFLIEQMGTIRACDACHSLIQFPIGSLSGQQPTMDDLQAKYASVVKTLHDYETAGMPSNHPNRLHLLEKFFSTVAQGSQSESPAQVPSPQSGSHLPPRRGAVLPQPRVLQQAAPSNPSDRPIQPEASIDRMASFRNNTTPPVQQPRDTAFRPSRTVGLDRLTAESGTHDHKAPPMEEARLLTRRKDLRFSRFSEPPEEISSTGIGKVGVFGMIILAMGTAVFAGMYLYKVKDQQAVSIEPESISRSSLLDPPSSHRRRTGGDQGLSSGVFTGTGQ